MRDEKKEGCPWSRRANDHPSRSRVVSPTRLSQILVMYLLLQTAPWNQLPLTVHFFEHGDRIETGGAGLDPPSHVYTTVGTMVVRHPMDFGDDEKKGGGVVRNASLFSTRKSQCGRLRACR